MVRRIKIKYLFKKGYIPWNKGKSLSEEHKNKLKGRIPWSKGKQLSEEIKQKISLGCKERYARGRKPWNEGISPSEEVNIKNALAHLGKHHNEKTKRKMSKSHAGFKHTKESISKISQSKRGHFVSEETKLKMSETQKKRCLSKEVRKKLRMAALKSVECLKNKQFYNTKPELEMKSILDNLNIQYIHPYSVWGIEHCYQADFYLTHQNLILEVDGKHWHNYPDGLEIDKIRTQELLERNFKVVRFWEDNFTKEQVKSTLEVYL